MKKLTCLLLALCPLLTFAQPNDYCTCMDNKDTYEAVAVYVHRMQPQSYTDGPPSTSWNNHNQSSFLPESARDEHTEEITEETNAPSEMNEGQTGTEVISAVRRVSLKSKKRLFRKRLKRKKRVRKYRGGCPKM